MKGSALELDGATAKRKLAKPTGREKTYEGQSKCFCLEVVGMMGES